MGVTDNSDDDASHKSSERGQAAEQEETTTNAETATTTSSSASTSTTNTPATRRSRFASRNGQQSSSLAIEKKGAGARVSPRSGTTSTRRLQSTRRVWSSRRRNTETPDMKQPLPSNSSNESSSAAVSFLEEKRNLAHRSSARTFIVAQQGRSNFSNSVPPPSPLKKKKIMDRRDPAADGEEEDYTGVLEYTAIIDAQQQQKDESDTLDLAIRMSTTTSSRSTQQQKQQETVPLPSTKLDSEIHVRSSRRDLTRRAQSTRRRARIVDRSSTQSPNANRRILSNDTATSDLMHAPEDDDKTEATPQPGAFNTLLPTYVIGEETGEAGEDDDIMEFEEIESDVEQANSSAATNGAQQQQEQRYRRTSSYSTGTVMAIPVGEDDEPMQAQVVGVDVSGSMEIQNGGASDGVDAILEQRLRRKTNRMLIRFSILFVIVVVAAVGIIVLVVSNRGDSTANPEGATPTTAPEAPVPALAAPSQAPTLLISSPSQYISFPTPLEATPFPTNAPTFLPSLASTVLRESFLAELQLTSPTTSFENATSPQSKARDWLFFSDDGARLNSFGFDRLFQLFALATLFYATGGETTWNQVYVVGGGNDGAAPRWLSTADVSECNWPGLRCNGDNILTDLDLRDFGLTGTLPPEAGLLTKLEYFLVTGNVNQIGGTIPSQLGLLTGLIRLSLHSNQLKGTIPTELGGLIDLEFLGLGRNDFLTGTIPTEVMLPKLTDLSLDNNDLSGPIPTEIGLVTALNGLSVFRNSNIQQLPTELGLLTVLRIAFLDSMGCTGTIPSELGQLTRLVSLHLTRNRLTGTIFTELGHMTLLEELLLGDNLLYGPLPSEALANLTSLTSLDVASLADVTGTIPSSLCHANGGSLTKVQLDSTRVTFNCPIPAGL